ncbi:SCO family protein [Nocardiopsis coralliicola]
MRTIHWGAAAAAAALLTGCAGPQAATGDDSPYHGSPIDSFTLPDAEFTDQHGDPYHLRDDSAGRYTALFFGFTNCPDICPTTMADLSQAVDRLGEPERADFGVVFVTADPDRDDPELLDMWLSSFNPSFSGLSGDIATTDAAAEELGIMVDRPAEDERDGDYQVGHGSQVLLFGPDGESRLMWSYGTGAEEIAEDLTAVMEEER